MIQIVHLVEIIILIRNDELHLVEIMKTAMNVLEMSTLNQKVIGVKQVLLSESIKYKVSQN
jgi:hypothetical protein